MTNFGRTSLSWGRCVRMTLSAWLMTPLVFACALASRLRGLRLEGRQGQAGCLFCEGSALLIPQARGAAAAALADETSARGEVGHDGAAILGREGGPCCNFVDASVTADAYPRLGVDDAGLDAGAFDFGPFPDVVRRVGMGHESAFGKVGVKTSSLSI